MGRARVIFASTNTGKISEFKERLALDDGSFEVIGLKDLGYTIPECEETGKTFQENAIIKVIHTRKYLNAEHKRSILIGDDSGMSIRALKGEPGVHTRRWTGKAMSDDEIIDYCLRMLKSQHDRSADYITAYALLEPTSDTPYIIEERTHGEILDTPRPESYVKGIPFRCLFYMPEIGAMFHEARELPDLEKRNIHIGHEIALDKCRSFLKMSIELGHLKEALAASWSLETSSLSELWSEDKPTVGQCAVSALLVQDILGGEIIRCMPINDDTERSHYFNRLPDGWTVDLTRSQLPSDVRYKDETIADRERVLSHTSTAKRYGDLKRNFYQNLQFNSGAI